MPSDELAAYLDRARQQTEYFLSRSREQMLSSVHEQRTQLAGIPYGGGFVNPVRAGGGDYPQAGTPAGRLLETITELARRGVTTAGGVVTAPVAAAVGGVANAGQFMMGGAPFGPNGIWGGSMFGAQRNMGFMQSAFTAFGAGLNFPFPIGDLGRWAGQRLDMTADQARDLAREELTYRTLRGGQRALWGAFDAASMGLATFQMRRAGLGLENVYSHEFARNLQNQLRFVGADALQAAGVEVGPFGTGTTRRGARQLAGELARNLGGLEAEMGLAPAEIMNLQNRAMGTMGITGIERALKGGTLAPEVGRQTRAVRDVQQALNLSEDEAKAFWDTIGQMYGTADRVAGMAKDATRYAGQWSMNKRQVFEMMREFEDMGRTMAMGAERTRGMGMEYVAEMRGQQRLGVITREEMMRYGGQTEEEAMAIRTRVQMQQNLAMFAGGRMRGFDVMAMARGDVYGRFMGGGMGAMEMAGAIGETMARDPTAGLRARYDPRLRARMGREGARLQFQRIQAEREAGWFIFGTEEQMIGRFEEMTGLPPEDAAQQYRIFQRERAVFGRQLKDLGVPPAEGRHVQNIYHELMGRGMLGYLMAATGSRTPYEGAAKLYAQMRDPSTGAPRTGQSLEGWLRRAGETTETPEMIRRTLGVRGQALAGMMGVAGVSTRGILEDIRAGARTSGWGMMQARGRTATPVDRTRIEDVRLMRTMLTSESMRDLVTEVVARGGDPTQVIMGGTVRAKGGEGDWTGELTSEGLMKVSYGGKTEEIRIQDLNKKYGDVIGDQVFGTLRKSLMTISERTKGLRPGTENMLRQLYMGKLSDISTEVFGEALGGKIGLGRDLPTFVNALANVERFEGGADYVNKLILQGRGGLARFAGAFKSAGAGQFAVEDFSSLGTLFGSEEDTAAKLAEIFAASGDNTWDKESITKAIKNKSQAFATAISRDSVVYDLVNQLQDFGEQERSTSRGSSESNPMVTEISSKSIEALAKRMGAIRG